MEAKVQKNFIGGYNVKLLGGTRTEWFGPLSSTYQISLLHEPTLLTTFLGFMIFGAIRLAFGKLLQSFESTVKRYMVNVLLVQLF